MSSTINQQNLYLLLPGKIATLAQFYAEDHKCSMLDAIHFIYTTPLYKNLSDESSKLWHLGATALYEEL